jgi:hypothetical protein
MRSLADKDKAVLPAMNKHNLKRGPAMVRIDQRRGKATISFNRELYKPEAIFQAACSFFDRMQVLVDLVGDRIVVTLQLFDKRKSAKNIAREFCELVYSYRAYQDREERTRDVREELLLLLKRAREK